jgi:nucleoside-diphosphate-sugar epimerase
VITGANGFFGRAVLRTLEAGGRVGDARALVRRPGSLRELHPRLDVVTGDVTKPGDWASALEGAHTVIHLANKTTDEDGTGFARVNVGGTRAVAEAAAAAGVERVLYVSSVGVYGHVIHRGSDERTPVAPDTPFSRSKAMAEAVLIHHHRAGHFRAFILRPRFVYGDGDRFVIARFIRAAGASPFTIDHGRAKMSFVLVEEIADALITLATQTDLPRDPNPVYHITDGRPVSVAEVIQTLVHDLDLRPRRTLSLPFGLVHGALRARERLLGIDPENGASGLTSLRVKLIGRDNYFSNEKLRSVLAGEFTPFADGLARHREYYRQFIRA